MMNAMSGAVAIGKCLFPQQKRWTSHYPRLKVSRMFPSADRLHRTVQEEDTNCTSQKVCNVLGVVHT